MRELLTHCCSEIPTPFADVRLHGIDLAAARGDYLRFAELLATDENERAALFHYADDRVRFVVTRGVLRILLAEAEHGPPETLTLGADAHGKLELLHPSSLRFNVSHSGEVALVALAEGREVGVDVEQVRERSDLDDVAARFFAPTEARALARSDRREHAQAFHRCWVRKEACVKAAGLGIRVPLAGFEVGVDPRPGKVQTVRIGAKAAARSFALADVEVRPGYAAAVAVALRHGDQSP